MNPHSSVLWLVWHFSFLFFSFLILNGRASSLGIQWMTADTAGLSPASWSAPAEFPARVLQQILSHHLRCLCKYGWVTECMGNTPGSLSTGLCEHSCPPFSLSTHLAQSFFWVLPSSLMVREIHEKCDARIYKLYRNYMRSYAWSLAYC